VPSLIPSETKPTPTLTTPSASRSPAQAPPPNAYRYTGEQFDADLGLGQYYLRARYLDPGTGRFWSQDRYEGQPGEPLTLHKYLYAHSNPMSNVDPSGFIAITADTITASSVLSILANSGGRILAATYLTLNLINKRWTITIRAEIDPLHFFVLATRFKAKHSFRYEYVELGLGLSVAAVVRRREVENGVFGQVGLPIFFPVFLSDLGQSLWEKSLGEFSNEIFGGADRVGRKGCGACLRWAAWAYSKAVIFSLLPL